MDPYKGERDSDFRLLPKRDQKVSYAETDDDLTFEDSG